MFIISNGGIATQLGWLILMTLGLRFAPSGWSDPIYYGCLGIMIFTALYSVYTPWLKALQLANAWFLGDTLGATMNGEPIFSWLLYALGACVLLGLVLGAKQGVADIRDREADLAARMAADPSVRATTTYLRVPYDDKDSAKELGARWDPDERAWYVPAGVPTSPFAAWIRE